MLTIENLHQPNFKFDYDKSDPVAVTEVAKATTEMIRPGIYTNIPEDIYHAMDLPSSHKLWHMRQNSPYHYWDRYINKDKEKTDLTSKSMLIGKAFHGFILEPIKAINQIKCAPKVDLRTKAGKEAMDLFKSGMSADAVILQEDDFEKVCMMCDAFWKSRMNKAHYESQKGALNEVTLIWNDRGVKMRARLDRVFENKLHDLKTAIDVSHYAFGLSSEKYGYAWQLMIYQRAWKSLTGETLSPLITAIETERPHQSKRYVVPDPVLEKESEIFDKILDVYQICSSTNKWPSYSEETENIFTRSTYFDDYNWWDYFVAQKNGVRS